ncbi:alpha/beta hydrolase family protein [Dyadobacter sp. CY323]|uniref:alpha/beta hydrolase n=1 Tax=Dyadobacter sp. CY323 TaxID=2907302 RepID=UPI001EEAC5CC|nr:alpha/beta hydrolase-fold protein [Dyadobacter sp. CY323]MCE6991844.1 esterase family protein [Dyadobacter sp. CY323]
MSRFRTAEISDPRFEKDHLRFITVKSPHLKGRGDICVFAPPDLGDAQSVPVIILLHGVYGSAWSWAYGTGVHIRAMGMIKGGEIPPVIIAMPSDGLWGDGSAYLPHHQCDFEKWIAEDVCDVLAEKIVGVDNDSPFFLGGLSMGGFGALRIGAKYGNRFSGIAAHSSITRLEQMELFVVESLDNYRQEDQVDEDVLSTFIRYRENLPPIRFDCGTSDQLIEHNRALHREMEKFGIPHEYAEHSGGHEWSYWEKHVIESIRFFVAQLPA